MARERDDDDEDEGDGKVEEDDEPVVLKKRKEVTTASILENFLLLATSLDDTVREESVARALGSTSSSSGSQRNGKNGKSKDNSDNSLHLRLVNQLNAQRQQIRETVREHIQSFAIEYDTESARLGEENPSEFDYDPEEQVNLPKERWNIDKAIEKLKELNDELKMECVDLGRTIRQQEKTLTKLVDEIVVQRQSR